MAGCGLLLLSPLLLLLYVLIRGRLGTPVLFRQERPGLHGRPFRIVKFRTMVDAHDEQGNELPDGARLTLLGKWLRAWSADELPELWNVLVGDMSLVGPRPLRIEYLPLYSRRQARRHEVRPGITGWAQIHGRNRTTWEERFELDLWYVDNHSARVDLGILARTFRQVLRRDGVSAEGHATMPTFTGTRGASRI